MLHACLGIVFHLYVLMLGLAYARRLLREGYDAVRRFYVARALLVAPAGYYTGKWLEDAPLEVPGHGTASFARQLARLILDIVQAVGQRDALLQALLKHEAALVARPARPTCWQCGSTDFSPESAEHGVCALCFEGRID